LLGAAFDAGTFQRRPSKFRQEELIIMSRCLTALTAVMTVSLAIVAASATSPAAAAGDADALKQATATCKAQIKEQSQYQEMSWYARHKAVKNCVKDALAHH
jgi:hypothetical protein